jgi:uncharacterized membrane protein YcaP (DUF421 family)
MLYQNLSDVWRIAVVGVLTYACLILLLRVAGKRSLAKLNAFDLVVTVALGSTLATILLSPEVALAEGVTALGLLVGLQLVSTWLSARFRWARRVLKSEPTLVVRDGCLLLDAMASQRVTAGEIRQAVRAHGLGDLADVAAVVVETDGNLSVIPADKAGALTALASADGVERPGTDAPSLG